MRGRVVNTKNRHLVVNTKNRHLVKTKTIKKDKTVSDWPGNAGWIITYLDFMQDHTTPNDYRLEHVVVFRTVVDQFGLGRYLYALNNLDPPSPPYPAGYNFAEQKAWSLRFGHEGTPEPQKTQEQDARNADWDKLKDYLQGKDSPTSGAGFKYRNLYINTHGEPKQIGGDWHVLDAKGRFTSRSVKSQRAYLTVKQTRDLLQTQNLDEGKPYRFVFLDGCNTAKGDFPQAFCGKNLPKSETDETFFGDPVNGWLARPRAFVGWTKEPIWGAAANGLGVCKGYRRFREVFFQEWQEGRTLRDALDEAARIVNTGQDDQYSWRDPENELVKWDDGLVVYGDKNLRIEEFNRKSMN